jgi:type II restriction enzyme
MNYVENAVDMLIKAAKDLVTSRHETRAGFIEFALEKNRRSKPYIESAKVFRHFALQADTPDGLLGIKEIRESLVTAAGLSDKALAYFTEADKNIAIQELIDNFLKPAGDEFVDEAVYRYLLIKGDSLGGSMRNIVGALAQQKLIRSLLSVLSVQGIPYHWLSKEKGAKWATKPDDDYGIEDKLKAIAWTNQRGPRTFAFNLTVPRVKNNIDLCLFDCNFAAYERGKIVSNESAPLMLGELKGGIDPAGADEHWKTANSALNRIYGAYSGRNPEILTSFVGAAIENNMAREIIGMLRQGTLAYAANLTKSEQVFDYCHWLLSL